MDEVMMTKRVRLTPTGNVVTAYELNEEESSLKSFHQLLGAANARPDGYNIVLQGDVTSLSKMSPGERRKVLDDVAGVTTYDDEIRKADRQRKEVEEYLERIALIEEEQRRHLKVLDGERKSAQKAIEIREELVAAKAVLWRAKVAGQKATLDHQRREIQRNLSDAAELEQQVSTAAKNLLALDDTIAELTRQIQDQLGGGGEALQAEINRLAVAVETAGDRLSDLAANDEEALVQKARLEEDLEGANSALDEAVAALDAATAMHEEASAALAKAREEEASVKALLATSDKDVALLARHAKAAEEEVENARAALANAQTDVDRSATAGELLLDEQHRSEEALGAARINLA
jgi:chromosome segregation protein